MLPFGRGLKFLWGSLARLFLCLLNDQQFLKAQQMELGMERIWSGDTATFGCWVLPLLTAVPGTSRGKRKEGCCYLPAFVCPTGQQRIKGEWEKQSNSCQQCTKLRREVTDGNSFDSKEPICYCSPLWAVETLCGKASETSCERQMWVWVAWEKMEERVALLVEGDITRRELSFCSALGKSQNRLVKSWSNSVI